METLPLFTDTQFDPADHHMRIAQKLARALAEQGQRDRARSKPPQGAEGAVGTAGKDKIAHAICDHLLASLRNSAA